MHTDGGANFERLGNYKRHFNDYYMCAANYYCSNAIES